MTKKKKRYIIHSSYDFNEVIYSVINTLLWLGLGVSVVTPVLAISVVVTTVVVVVVIVARAIASVVKVSSVVVMTISIIIVVIIVVSNSSSLIISMFLFQIKGILFFGFVHDEFG